MSEQRCLWVQDGVGESHWDTSRYNRFTINDGAPYANSMKFCCYCGKALEEQLACEEDVTEPHGTLLITERSTRFPFLPGDKVRDRRDHHRDTWRIVAMTAYLDTSLVTLRRVKDGCEYSLPAESLFPHLEMVAQRIEAKP